MIFFYVVTELRNNILVIIELWNNIRCLGKQAMIRSVVNVAMLISLVGEL